MDAQRHDDDESRQHEQRPGHDAATHAMQQPTDIGGELLRFRTGQQHAEIQRMDET